ncbi:TadE/TadG family type IV pilus assembly protein [Sneathiella aquimaris]|uniref:TadE/TadG family type IV pilus assembly protein n=1 Tax=Sneathiella aquimaris TaxID=2599305 RepID=UPI00146C7188|nr:TadE/TadG family type IV pilus assembly protein [Sneathiella aquimaris]
MKKLLRNFRTLTTGKIKAFAIDRTGVAMTEFAMMLPVLMILSAGSFEVARYALINQKMDRIVATLSDLVARSDGTSMTETEISNIIDSARYMARPFDFSNDSMIVLTSVQGRTSAAPYILSQRVSGAVTGGKSAIGETINGDATLPPAFIDVGSGETLPETETLVVAELIYSYKPYLVGALGLFDETVLYRDAYFRPRFTARITFPSAP